MPAKALELGHGTGRREPIAETVDEMPPRDDHAMSRHGAGAVAIAQREDLLRHDLDVGDERGARMIGPQQSTASQQMGKTRLVRGCVFHAS